MQEFSVGSDSISSPKTPTHFKSHYQRSTSESPGYNSDTSRGSVKNPAVDQLRQELSSLKSLVSKLEHVSGSEASGNGDDEEKMTVAEESKPHGSLLRLVMLSDT